MKQLNEYILEKLKVNKDVNNKVSEDNKFHVKSGDKVLIINKSDKSNKSRIYVSFKTGIIDEIKTERHASGEDLQMVYIDTVKEPFFIEDAQKLPKIPNTFAFRNTFDNKWTALYTVEKADTVLQQAQQNVNKRKQYFIQTWWLDSTNSKQTTIDLLRRELNI